MKEDVQTEECGYIEFTSERDERRKILAKSCIRKLDTTRVTSSRDFSAARPREAGAGQAFSKCRRTVSMKNSDGR